MKTPHRIYSSVLVISFFYLRPAREIETSSSSFSNTRRAMVRKLVHDTLIFSLVVLVLLFVCVWTALEFCSGHSHLSLITLLQGRSWKLDKYVTLSSSAESTFCHLLAAQCAATITRFTSLAQWVESLFEVANQAELFSQIKEVGWTLLLTNFVIFY